MPMPSWVSAVAVATALLFADASDAKSVMRVHAKADHIIDVAVGGRTVRVSVALDPTLINFADEHDVHVVGTRGHFALLVDSYASKKQGLSRCQSGNERYVRLIDLDRRQERFSKLAESCLKDVVPGDPIAAWDGDGHGFTVNVLSGPSRRYILDANGSVFPSP